MIDMDQAQRTCLRWYIVGGFRSNRTVTATQHVNCSKFRLVWWLTESPSNLLKIRGELARALFLALLRRLWCILSQTCVHDINKNRQAKDDWYFHVLLPRVTQNKPRQMNFFLSTQTTTAATHTSDSPSESSCLVFSPSWLQKPKKTIKSRACCRKDRRGACLHDCVTWGSYKHYAIQLL